MSSEKEPDVILRKIIHTVEKIVESVKWHRQFKERNDVPATFRTSVVISTHLDLLKSLMGLLKGNEEFGKEKYINEVNELYRLSLTDLDKYQIKMRSMLQNISDDGDKNNLISCTNISQSMMNPKKIKKFSDIIGLDNVKKSFINSFIRPVLYKNLYPELSKGILLYGPPGTGKTFIMKAVANELQCQGKGRINVLLFSPTGAELKGKYVGDTEKNIKRYFTCAQRAAQCCKHSNDKQTISIIFIDEIESIAANRQTDVTGFAGDSVSTLLQMMNGVEEFENVIVVGATNLPWNLDSAVLRRFSRQIFVNVLEDAGDLSNLFISILSKQIENGIEEAFISPKALTNENKKDKSDQILNKSNCDLQDNKPNDVTQNWTCQVPMKCDDVMTQKFFYLPPFLKEKVDNEHESYLDNNFENEIISFIEASMIQPGKIFSNSDIQRLITETLRKVGDEAYNHGIFYLQNINNKPIYVSGLNFKTNITNTYLERVRASLGEKNERIKLIYYTQNTLQQIEKPILKIDEVDALILMKFRKKDGKINKLNTFISKNDKFTLYYNKDFQINESTSGYIFNNFYYSFDIFIEDPPNSKQNIIGFVPNLQLENQRQISNYIKEEKGGLWNWLIGHKKANPVFYAFLSETSRIYVSNPENENEYKEIGKDDNITQYIYDKTHIEHEVLTGDVDIRNKNFIIMFKYLDDNQYKSIFPLFYNCHNEEVYVNENQHRFISKNATKVKVEFPKSLENVNKEQYKINEDLYQNFEKNDENTYNYEDFYRNNLRTYAFDINSFRNLIAIDAKESEMIKPTINTTELENLKKYSQTREKPNAK